MSVKIAVDTIITAGYVIPVVPKKQVLANTSVVIKNGLIVDLLPNDQVFDKYEAKEVYDRKNHAIIPGFVNAHTHMAMCLLRGYSDDKELNNWLNEDIWPVEGKFISKDFIQDGVKMAMCEMIRGGTTCFNDMYFRLPDAIEVFKPAGIRGVMGVPVFAFPTSDGKTSEDYLKLSEDLLTKYKDTDPLLTFSLAPHAPYTVPDTLYRQAKDICEKYGVIMHSHIQETASELNNSIENNKGVSCHISDQKCSPIANLARLGVLDNLVAAHCVHMTPEDITLMSKHHASIVHNPKSNLKLNSGICPVQEALNQGVNVCLGTDGAASNNSLDMMSEMQYAALLGKFRADSPIAIDAATALEMSTLNGAKALHLDDKIGSIQINKHADIIAINLDEIETCPHFDPIASIVYSANKSLVTDAWVEGKILMKNRELTTLDVNEVKEHSKEWKKQLVEFRNSRNH